MPIDTTDRRKSQRRQASVSIYLTYPGQRRIRCRTQNLSAGGVFVQTSDASIPQGITVELVFVIKRGRIARLHRRWAVVTHVNRDGAGMMLYNHRDATLWSHSPGLSM